MKVLLKSELVQSADQEKSQMAIKHFCKEPNAMLEALLQQMTLAPEELKGLDAIKKRFKRFALVGMGGSSLGVQVLAQFFARTEFVFFDNVDAIEFETQIQNLGQLDEVFWLFISKSGETIETLAVLEFVDQIYSAQKLSLKSNSLVITEKKQNSLTLWAQKNKVLQFEVPVQVGGRFSVLSYVGLIPAYLMDLNLKALKSGAEKTLADQKELTEFVAEVLASFRREEWITVLWSYSSRLKSFGLWWQQLWAESLAKKTDLAGKKAQRVSTPLPLIGATDQHSVLQQVNEGYRDKFIVFLRASASETGALKLNQAQTQLTESLQGLSLGDLLKAEVIATQQSLTEENVSNMTLQIEKYDEENLGRLLMFMQISVLVLGHALNINPLNQPGVERGKVLCKKNLSEIKSQK